MLLFAQIQLQDHPSVFGIAELLIAIAAEFSVGLCHIYLLLFPWETFQLHLLHKGRSPAAV